MPFSTKTHIWQHVQGNLGLMLQFCFFLLFFFFFVILMHLAALKVSLSWFPASSLNIIILVPTAAPFPYLILHDVLISITALKIVRTYLYKSVCSNHMLRLVSVICVTVIVTVTCTGATFILGWMAGYFLDIQIV